MACSSAFEALDFKALICEFDSFNRIVSSILHLYRIQDASWPSAKGFYLIFLVLGLFAAQKNVRDVAEIGGRLQRFLVLRAEKAG